MQRFPAALITALSLFCILQCAPPPTDEQRGAPEIRFEEVWVDPRLVSSTDTYTLLRANRVDSVLHDPSLPVSQPVNAVSFVVPFKPCRAVVSLIVARTMRSTLLDTTLSAGYYRLTLTSVGTPTPSTEANARPVLLAEVCGKRISRLLQSPPADSR